MKKGQFSCRFLFVLNFLYEIKRSVELQPCFLFFASMHGQAPTNLQPLTLNVIG